MKVLSLTLKMERVSPVQTWGLFHRSVNTGSSFHFLQTSPISVFELRYLKISIKLFL